jgi:hypothetical protein
MAISAVDGGAIRKTFPLVRGVTNGKGGREGMSFVKGKKPALTVPEAGRTRE